MYRCDPIFYFARIRSSGTSGQKNATGLTRHEAKGDRDQAVRSRVYASASEVSGRNRLVLAANIARRAASSADTIA